MDRIGANTARSPLSSGAAEALGLRAGASVVLRALAPAADGRWAVLVAGKRLTAAVSVPLSPGVRYSARVGRLPGDSGWVFHILGRASDLRTAEALRSAGLPGDPRAALILKALMAEGLPLDSKTLARLRSALSKQESHRDKGALMARALAKGLDPESAADALDALSPLSGPGSGGERKGGAGGEDGGNAASEGRKRSSADAGRGQEGNAGPAFAPGSTVKDDGKSVWKDYSGLGDDSLADLLAFLATRSSAEPNAYQLFNSRSAPRGRWIYAPYRFEREGVAFSGTLRILIQDGSGQPAVLAADIHTGARGSERLYSFALRHGATGLSLSLSTGDERERERLSRKAVRLARELSRRGCSLTIDSEELSDGPWDAPETGYEPVDDHA